MVEYKSSNEFTVISVGRIYPTSDGPVMVIRIIDRQTVEVIFMEPPNGVTQVKVGNLRNGLVRNRLKPTVIGVGCIGYGPHKTGCMAHKKWLSMLNRVHELRSYEDVTICKDWYNFQNFAEWFEQQRLQIKGFDSVDFRWVLDKDLRWPGNREYGPDGCCLAPHAVNMLFNAHTRRQRDLPLGVSRHSHGYSAQCHSLTDGLQFLGVFPTVGQAQQAYWKAKIEAIWQVTNSKYGQFIQDDVLLILYNFNMTDALAYYGDQAIIWTTNERPPIRRKPGVTGESWLLRDGQEPVLVQGEPWPRTSYMRPAHP